MNGLPVAAAICVGACAGALLRWRLGMWLNGSHALLPWGTLAANWLAAWLIGLALGAAAHWNIAAAWRALIITGFLGALSTFSTFSAEMLQLLQAQRIWHAALLAALHLFGSLLLVWAGLRCFSGGLTP